MERERERESFSEKTYKVEKTNDILSKAVGFLYPVYTSRVSTGRLDQNWFSTYQDLSTYHDNREEIRLKYEEKKWSITRIPGTIEHDNIELKEEDHDIMLKEFEMIPFSTLVLAAIQDGQANLELLEIFDQDSQQKITQYLIDFFSAQFSLKSSGQRSVFDDPTDGAAKLLFKNAKIFFDLTQTKKYLPKPTFIFDENNYLPKQQESLTEEFKPSRAEKSPTYSGEEEESSGCFPKFWRSSSDKKEETEKLSNSRVEKETERPSKRPHVEEKETIREEGVFDLEMGEMGGSNNSNS